MSATSQSMSASQGGYTVDYANPTTQGGFPGSYLNQNSQAGYSRFGTRNDFMSQGCNTIYTTNMKSTSARFFLVATCNAVKPDLSGSITIVASASSSNFTTSLLTPFTAICNAVCPFLSVFLVSSGSLSSKAFTISTCPDLAAKDYSILTKDLQHHEG
ncbi:hypothetical protein L6452_05624 [Arctium lappa]|uniref:Uncharacterized protein n=1 Tax=Arctium lappa TaxID=4217 RepID=A0ACB9EH78_ARCLA|nr:hypothetical protein L6452_05624 [Arctium lappa]